MESFTLVVDALSATGEAVGTHPESGKVVFVADAVPGETVEVAVAREHPRWIRGRLLRVLEASPDRVVPPCPYFGPPHPVALPDGSVLNPDGAPRCAGCLWQHIDYERQLSLKRTVVIEQILRGIGQRGNPRVLRQEVDDLVADVIALGDPEGDGQVLDYGYLLQMGFAVDDEGQPALPARPDEAHRDSESAAESLVSIDLCLLHHPQLAELFDAFAVDAMFGPQESSFNGTRTSAGSMPLVQGVEMSVGGATHVIADETKGSIVVHGRGGQAPDLESELPVNVLFQPHDANESIELLVGEWSYPVRNSAELPLISYPSLGGAAMSSHHVMGDEAIGQIAADLLDIQPYDHVVHVWAGAGLATAALAPYAATVIAIEDDELAVAALQSNAAHIEGVALHRGPAERMLKQIRQKGYEATVALLTPWRTPVTSIVLKRVSRLALARFALVVENGEDLARFVDAAQAQQFQLSLVQPLDLHAQQSHATLMARFDRQIV